jgi:indolepyruvate ferredoxin oxidoreductase beta subunit
MDREGTNILLAGVGGLGVITASNIIGIAAVGVGKKVSSAEVHGIAQRGGSVTGTVRIGDNSVSPLLGDGRADIILGFEPLEVLRNISKASKSTVVITDITPVRVITPTKFVYPKLEDIFAEIRGRCARLYEIDCLALAKKAGTAVVRPSVLLGALSEIEEFPISSEVLLKSVEENVPARYKEQNVAAFKEGASFIRAKL